MKIINRTTLNDYLGLIQKGVRKEQFITETVKHLGNMFKWKTDNILLYSNLYLLIRDFFYAMNLVGKKIYSFPTFNNDLLRFLLEQECVFLEMKSLFEGKLNVNAIEKDSILIIPSIFGSVYRVKEKDLIELAKKNVFVLPVITDYNLISGYYDTNYLIVSFSQNCSFYMEDISVLFFKKNDIDFRLFGNSGFMGSRYFIWNDNMPSLSSQFYLVKAIQNYVNMRNYFEFFNNFIKEKLTDKEYFLLLNYLLVKSKNEKLTKLNMLHYFPTVKFPASYRRILDEWRFLELDIFNYEALDRQLKEI